MTDNEVTRTATYPAGCAVVTECGKEMPVTDARFTVTRVYLSDGDWADLSVNYGASISHWACSFNWGQGSDREINALFEGDLRVRLPDGSEGWCLPSSLMVAERLMTVSGVGAPPDGLFKSDEE